MLTWLVLGNTRKPSCVDAGLCVSLNEIPVTGQGVKSHRFMLLNDTGVSVSWDLMPSCGCVEAQPQKGKLGPGDGVWIEAVVDEEKFQPDRRTEILIRTSYRFQPYLAVAVTRR